MDAVNAVCFIRQEVYEYLQSDLHLNDYLCQHNYFGPWYVSPTI